MNVLKKLMGGAYKIASTEIAVKNGLGKAVTLDTLPMGFKFSTAEQWTGQYWIDGSKIYTKSFAVSAFSKNKITIATGILKVQKTISFSGAFSRAGTDYEYSLDNTYMGEYNFKKNTGYFEIATNNEYVSFSGHVTMFYICTDR